VMGNVFTTPPKGAPLEDILPLLDTGDILLFAGEAPISYAIECITRCRFSHGRISTYRGSAIAFRKLLITSERRKNMERNMWLFAERHASVDDYAAKWIDISAALCYPCSLSCIPRGTPNRYQCASLVAKCYSDVDLLDLEGEPVQTYTPEDFTSSQQLTLTHDAHLGPELYIEVRNKPRWKTTLF